MVISYSAFQNVWAVDISIKKSSYRRLWRELCVKRDLFLFEDTHISTPPSVM